MMLSLAKNLELANIGVNIFVEHYFDLKIYIVGP